MPPSAGTLQFISLGGFTLQPGNQITFLTAKNGVSGTFNNTQNGLVTTGTIVNATSHLFGRFDRPRSDSRLIREYTGSRYDTE